MLRKTFTTTLQTVFSLAVALFFAAFGYHTHNPNLFGGPSIYVPPSFSASVALGWHTLVQTLHGQNMLSQYWGTTWQDIWVSVRLIAVTIALAMMMGTLLAVIQSTTRRRFVRQTLEWICGWFEAIPEALYVILTVVLTLFLIEHTSIQLPVFPVLVPNWNDTWVPAIAIGIPAGLHVWRMLMSQLEQELTADYVRTALSKGASRRRAFYLHVMQNVLPTLRQSFQSAALIVLSTVPFVEFYMSYEGALFHFTDAVGWNMNLGIIGEQKAAGVPSYQVGLTFELLALLIIIGAIVSLLVGSWRKDPTEFGTAYASPRGQFGRGWLTIGLMMLGCVLVCGTFPQLVTAASPTSQNQVNLSDPNSVGMPPYPPSSAYPLGTDGFGRDLLARTLHGTWPTLWPALVTTLCIVLVGCVVAAIAACTRRAWLRRGVEMLSGSVAALPLLPLIFLALYNRNYQAPAWVQATQFILWLLLFESGRCVNAFYTAMSTWMRFGFMEGVTSVGRSRPSALLTHLKSWLGQFALQYAFSEFARTLSIMTMLSAFHIYLVEAVGFVQFVSMYPPVKGFVSGQISWFQMLGDTTNSMAYVSYPFLLFAPVLALLITTMGANFVAKGLRLSQREA